VPPGDLDAVCDRITEGLCSFRDAASGDPIVEEVRRTRDLFENGPQADRLPDLVVRWKETPAAVHHALVSDRLGRIERATPGRIPNGRSGNHRSQGWLIARGPGIPAGATLEREAHILDLAPTALDLLGAESAVPLAGKPIPLEQEGN